MMIVKTLAMCTCQDSFCLLSYTRLSYVGHGGCSRVGTGSKDGKSP